VVTALAKVQKELSAMGFGLKIFDGYRPLSVQKKFWDAVADIFPDENERALYVANPKIGSKHNRGAAVDITLIDLVTGKEFEMPSGYDEFSEKAYRDYSKMTINSRKNCKLLELIMKKHGFDGAYSEWWHFDFNGWEKYPIFDVIFNDLEKKKINRCHY
jgi:D-alanyl-D-alanine dipeptidase